jgi:hypothetical protein
MENDTVRTLGDNTLVDIWIEGKSRAITISRQAIEARAGATLNETERREFVRTNLANVVRAATEILRSNPTAEAIVIEAGQLGGSARSSSGERRSGGDRRKGDRRQRNVGPPGGVERRGR